MVSRVAGKEVYRNNIPGPLGVRGRNSDNRLIGEKLGWRPSQKLQMGISKTYQWIKAQVEANGNQS
jgi:nucleoside-diphosphate-sugar epimerase